MKPQTAYQRNKEYILAKNKEYYELNKETINKKRNEQYKLKSNEELEELRAYKRKYYQENKDKVKKTIKTRYEKKRDEILANSKEYAKANYHLIRLRAIKGRAIKNNIPFDLDLDYLKSIPLPKVCPVLGIPLDGSTKGNYPSLDRIIPNLGYIKGNVCFISTRANLLKNDASIEEVKLILQYMEAFVIT